MVVHAKKTMNDNVATLLQHIRATMQTLDSCRLIVQQAAEHPAPKKRALAQFFLYTDLHEGATLFGLIYKITHSLREISGRLDRFQTNPPGEHRERRIEPTSEEGQLWQERFELTAELKVLTKAIYEWLYHIREDINSEPTLKAAVPTTLRSQLERYCTFRNILVTHKKGRKVHASAGLRHMNDFSKFEILLVPFATLPEKVIQHLTGLYDKAKPHLDSAEALQENIIERMAILYRRLHRFPGELQAEVKTFLTHYGTISDTPNDMAAFLNEFTTAIASHLNNREVGYGSS